jgi:hypothetical protein
MSRRAFASISPLVNLVAAITAFRPRKEIAMRTTILATALALLASTAVAQSLENQWRLEFSGNAEAAGRIVLQVAPAEGEPIRAIANIVQGRGENDVASDVVAALQASLGTRYAVEGDDGEDVLVKKQQGQLDFVVTVVENSVPGVRINLDAE